MPETPDNFEESVEVADQAIEEQERLTSDQLEARLDRQVDGLAKELQDIIGDNDSYTEAFRNEMDETLKNLLANKEELSTLLEVIIGEEDHNVLAFDDNLLEHIGAEAIEAKLEQAVSDHDKKLEIEVSRDDANDLRDDFSFADIKEQSLQGITDIDLHLRLSKTLDGLEEQITQDITDNIDTFSTELTTLDQTLDTPDFQEKIKDIDNRIEEFTLENYLNGDYPGLEEVAQAQVDQKKVDEDLKNKLTPEQLDLRMLTAEGISKIEDPNLLLHIASTSTNEDILSALLDNQVLAKLDENQQANLLLTLTHKDADITHDIANATFEIADPAKQKAILFNLLSKDNLDYGTFLRLLHSEDPDIITGVINHESAEDDLLIDISEDFQIPYIQEALINNPDLPAPALERIIRDSDNEDIITKAALHENSLFADLFIAFEKVENPDLKLQIATEIAKETDHSNYEKYLSPVIEYALDIGNTELIITIAKEHRLTRNDINSFLNTDINDPALIRELVDQGEAGIDEHYRMFNKAEGSVKNVAIDWLNDHFEDINPSEGRETEIYLSVLDYALVTQDQDLIENFLDQSTEMNDFDIQVIEKVINDPRSTTSIREYAADVVVDNEGIDKVSADTQSEINDVIVPGHDDRISTEHQEFLERLEYDTNKFNEKHGFDPFDRATVMNLSATEDHEAINDLLEIKNLTPDLLDQLAGTDDPVILLKILDHDNTRLDTIQDIFYGAEDVTVKIQAALYIITSADDFDDLKDVLSYAGSAGNDQIFVYFIETWNLNTEYIEQILNYTSSDKIINTLLLEINDLYDKEGKDSYVHIYRIFFDKASGKTKSECARGFLQRFDPHNYLVLEEQTKLEGGVSKLYDNIFEYAVSTGDREILNYYVNDAVPGKDLNNIDDVDVDRLQTIITESGSGKASKKAALRLLKYVKYPDPVYEDITTFAMVNHNKDVQLALADNYDVDEDVLDELANSRYDDVLNQVLNHPEANLKVLHTLTLSRNEEISTAASLAILTEGNSMEESHEEYMADIFRDSIQGGNTEVFDMYIQEGPGIFEDTVADMLKKEDFDTDSLYNMFNLFLTHDGDVDMIDSLPVIALDLISKTDDPAHLSMLSDYAIETGDDDIALALIDKSGTPLDILQQLSNTESIPTIPLKANLAIIKHPDAQKSDIDEIIAKNPKESKIAAAAAERFPDETIKG